MNVKSSKPPKIVKVDRRTFERFLKDCDVQHWDVDDFREFKELEMTAVTVDELMFTLGLNYDEDDQPHIYISSDDDSWDGVDPASWDLVPTVTVDELSRYTHTSGGNDFLYFSFHSDEAFNGNYLTLLIADTGDSDEDAE